MSDYSVTDSSHIDQKARTRIDQQVSGDAEPLRRSNLSKSGWVINLYQQAGEASGSFRSSSQKANPPPNHQRLLEANSPESQLAQERSLEESDRRARRQIRRYCAHNKLNRLITRTYSGEGCFDQHTLRDHLAEFVRDLRRQVGSDFPYCWVPEWHTNHGLHAHIAVGRYIKKSLIDQAWGRGFTHIKILGDLPHGSQEMDQARLAAGYLSKYVSKSFFDERHLAGLHRYDIAQGFTPKPIKLFRPKLDEVLSLAVEKMGSPFTYIWHSNDDPNWNRPSAVYISW